MYPDILNFNNLKPCGISLRSTCFSAANLKIAQLRLYNLNLAQIRV